MGRALDISAMLRKASPATRREILKLGVAGGIAAPALLAMLTKDGVKPVYASPAAATLQGEPVQGGTLVLIGHQEVASLHPDDATDGATVHWVMVTQMFNALVEQDENFAFQPVLAMRSTPDCGVLRQVIDPRQSPGRTSCRSSARRSKSPAACASRRRRSAFL